MEEKLRDVHIQIEDLKQRNKAPEEQILLAGNGKNVGKGDTVTVKPVGEKCLVLRDSIVRNVGAEKPNTRVECFPGIRGDQLRRVMENRDFGHSDVVVIYLATNDVRRFRNLDYIMGEVYDLVNTATDYTWRGASSLERHQKDPERRQIKNVLRWVWKLWRQKKLWKKR